MFTTNCDYGLELKRKRWSLARCLSITKEGSRVSCCCYYEPRTRRLFKGKWNLKVFAPNVVVLIAFVSKVPLFVNLHLNVRQGVYSTRGYAAIEEVDCKLFSLRLFRNVYLYRDIHRESRYVGKPSSKINSHIKTANWNIARCDFGRAHSSAYCISRGTTDVWVWWHDNWLDCINSRYLWVLFKRSIRIWDPFIWNCETTSHQCDSDRKVFFVGGLNIIVVHKCIRESICLGRTIQISKRDRIRCFIVSHPACKSAYTVIDVTTGCTRRDSSSCKLKRAC